MAICHSCEHTDPVSNATFADLMRRESASIGTRIFRFVDKQDLTYSMLSSFKYILVKGYAIFISAIDNVWARIMDRKKAIMLFVRRKINVWDHLLQVHRKTLPELLKAVVLLSPGDCWSLVFF